MKEAVTKVIDTLTQEDFHGAFQKLLERYNKCIAAGGDYFEVDLSFMSVLSIKVPIRKKSGNLLNYPRIYLSIYCDFSSSWTLKFSFTCYHFVFLFFFLFIRSWILRVIGFFLLFSLYLISPSALILFLFLLMFLIQLLSSSSFTFHVQNPAHDTQIIILGKTFNSPLLKT